MKGSCLLTSILMNYELCAPVEGRGAAFTSVSCLIVFIKAAYKEVICRISAVITELPVY